MMTIKVKLAVSHPGRAGVALSGDAIMTAINEDVVGHVASAAWVIDGASGVGAPLTAQPSDAGYFARLASAALGKVLGEAPEDDLVPLVERVIAQLGDRFHAAMLREPVAAYELPSAAVALVRQLGAEVELAALGDCRVIYEDGAGAARLFGTTGLSAIETRTNAAARQLLDSDPMMSADELVQRLLPQLRVNRALMNRPDGYWVLSTDPTAAQHVDRLRVGAAPGARFAIVSDGLLRLVDLFGVATPADLLAIDTPADWRRWLTLLRDMEAQSGSLHDYPRVKRHDDASLLHLTMEGVV